MELVSDLVRAVIPYAYNYANFFPNVAILSEICLQVSASVVVSELDGVSEVGILSPSFPCASNIFKFKLLIWFNIPVF